MSVKLYRHNESGEVVAAGYVVDRSIKGKFSYYAIFNGQFITERLSFEEFNQDYTPLPEAPEVGSTAWAWQMLEQGKSIIHPKSPNSFFSLKDGWLVDDKGNKASVMSSSNDWQLYSPPKPIVELLPHEFVKGEKILCRDELNKNWIRNIFGRFNLNISKPFFPDGYQGSWRYCIPFEGNEHIEGTITDGEHGAVPRGYVPPHVPQLGDDDYWCVGDEVVNLVRGDVNIIVEILKNKIHLDNGFWYDIHADFKVPKLRTLYHKGSYVRDDGTVHEHIPTRPHRIEDAARVADLERTLDEWETTAND